ncbi:hypothetical protein [Bifidobacterium vansinderenii]|uniref:Uncharacterized protein n=1 Tax=Bifidobacterium vansinderenii TaxID=1984871 RepID=A0A229W193_9BIFI|nr:hypothetical protein [Bifidobacterium vansinderenii]OXN01629.1 hypothetical protein Tam10B_0071 [Bifidobacterium vansinderenii]
MIAVQKTPDGILVDMDDARFVTSSAEQGSHMSLFLTEAQASRLEDLLARRHV